MKKLLFLAALAITGISAFAQDDVLKAAEEAAAAIANAPKAQEVIIKPSYWTNSVDFDLGLNQTALFNWAAGGNNTMTLGFGLDGKAYYDKDLTSWKNRLQLNYGFLWSSDKRGLLQKNNDRIYFESKLAMKTKKDSKWNYTAALDFRTQFTDGFKENSWEEIDGKWVGKKVSDFFAPAYLNLALGIEWDPNDWFTLNIAPATGGFVFCSDRDLRPSYGMKPYDDDPLEYHSSLFQLGTQVKADIKLSVNEKFNYETQLVLFYDYLYDYSAKNTSDFPIRVNWDNKISYRAARFFKIALNTWMIYDPIILFTEQDPTVGDHRVQLKEFFSISFAYSIGNKKKK